MAARRVFHLQPCGEKRSWQEPREGRGVRGATSVMSFAGSLQGCPLPFSPPALPFAVAERSGLALGCGEEGGLEGLGVYPAFPPWKGFQGVEWKSGKPSV